MSAAKWMDFSGAPAIILPESLAGAWNGMFVPLPGASRECDLKLPDGRVFKLLGLDLDRPATDYDQICGRNLDHRNGPMFVHPVGTGSALVIDSDGDGVVGWWPEQQMIVTVSEYLPDPSVFDRLEWRDEIRWQVPTSRLILMNSTLHGADPGKSESSHTVIELEPGEYSIARAKPEDGKWVLLHRFRRIPTL
jgi:hypothetical protein